MSSVLRKKIEAGAGIPPSILQFHGFWDPLNAAVSAWIFDTYGSDLKAVPDVRRVVAGNLANAQMDSLLAFGFGSRLSPGLCAIAVDEPAAGVNAARRLQQSTDDLAGVSPLFQKLLFEPAAIALWRLAAAGLKGHSTTTVLSPLADLAQVEGGFDPGQRYLLTGYKCLVGGQRAGIWLVHHLGYIQRLALDFEDAAARQRTAGSSKGRDTLRESVKSTTITVEGVLDRLPMTIGQCSRFEIGQLIALPDVDMSRISLQAETVNGRVDIGLCEMGVWKRQRALKLTTPVLEPFTRELAKL